jgi:peptide deformylase
MPMLKVRAYPDPVLAIRSKPVQTIDRRLRQLVDEMFETMYEEHGVGLAAPQVGESLRLCVVNCSGESDGELVLVNPVVVETAGKDVASEEGCLSVPGIRTNVIRPERVKVRAFDLTGQELEIDADDLEARCLQHEIDHLNGQLFIQRLSEASRMAIRRQIRKLESDYKSSS